ncbi:MAG: glutamate racemase [Bacteroidota bacterium]
MNNISSNRRIGVFDSGVGGLSVWKEIVELLPNESIIYYADSGNCPYGTKSREEIIKLSEKIVEFLIKKSCKLIVVACNTATAAAIDYLRLNYSIPFVGMEPAIKPAAIQSKTGNIGVLATENTFKGRLFNETSRKYANDKNLYIQIGYGLVDIVENGKINTKDSYSILEKYIQPMLDKNVDQIVLGCTHYPFLMEQIKEIVGTKSGIINPAPAVARQVENILDKQQIKNKLKDQENVFYSSGRTEVLKDLLAKMNIVDPEIIKI